ncbi:hypothetical protein BpHYR1_009863 [Brachionus plicatilis]|uniref:Uncharacterized protein n=1 Tax=Brachionus plicatilis TaxID=10195 RepID=A0A3M7SEE1_BRAPC|nr:hypothetical protein BpHYR1_009863 [Brachionus plicatilis]
MVQSSIIWFSIVDYTFKYMNFVYDHRNSIINFNLPKKLVDQLKGKTIHNRYRDFQNYSNKSNKN